MISFRLRHHGFMRPEFYTGRDGNYNAIPDISWYDENGDSPVWDKLGHCLALRMDGSKADILADQDDNDFFIMFNSGLDPVAFRLAKAPAKKAWVRAVDTSINSPEDVLPPGQEKPLAVQTRYKVSARSLVILISKS
jgi:glycogen operon protein